jgi:hypothetical protein
VATYLVSEAHGRPRPSIVGRTAPVISSSDPGVREKDAERVAALERRLMALESAGGGRGTVSASNVNDAGAEPRTAGSSAILDREEVAEQVEAQRTEWLGRLQRESRDPKWSSGAEASMDRDLEAMETTVGFRARRSDCRSTLCSADLEWPSYAAARKALNEVVAARYDMNCSTVMFLPAPDDVSTAYSSTLIRDCGSLRAEAR